MQNPLISFGSEASYDEAAQHRFTWDFDVPVGTVMEYISQVLAWARLTTLEDAGDGFSCADYWRRHVFLFDALEEDWGAEAVIGFDGRRLFDLLSMKIEPGQDEVEEEEDATERRRLAEDMTWRMLTRSSMQKVTHGKGLIRGQALGGIWDAPENEGSDAVPGTFAGLLRYGASHFRQTRPSVFHLEPPEPPVTYKKGVLEP